MSFDDVGVVLPVVVVEVLKELLLADDFARVVEQVFEDMVLGGREVDEDSAAMDGLLERVEFYIEGFERWVGGTLPTADKYLSAGNEFAEIEWLGEVVICSCVQELDDGLLAFSSSKNQNGRGVFAGAQAAQEFLAIKFGKHEIENDEVVAKIAGCGVASLAIGSPVDCKARAIAEGGREIVGKPDFVFNEQHTHVGTLHRENYGWNKIKWG